MISSDAADATRRNIAACVRDLIATKWSLWGRDTNTIVLVLITLGS